jgi:hypothetical protein
MFACKSRIVVAALAGCCSLAVATRATGFQFPEIQPQKFEIKGKISGLAPGLIQVAAENGELWVVKVDANLKEIKLTASAEPSWLQKGMFVEFENRFNARGQAVTAVTELKVFTPDAKTLFGATPLAEKSEELVAPAVQQTMRMKVTGRLAAYKDDKITVLAGNTPVVVTLAPILTISIDANDYRLSRPGDTIHVTGKYFVKGQGLADRIEIKGEGLYEGDKRRKQ